MEQLVYRASLRTGRHESWGRNGAPPADEPGMAKLVELDVDRAREFRQPKPLQLSVCWRDGHVF